MPDQHLAGHVLPGVVVDDPDVDAVPHQLLDAAQEVSSPLPVS